MSTGRTPVLLRTDEAAVLAEVAAATIRDWCRRRLLTPHGTSRCRLWNAWEVEAAVAAGKPRRTAVDVPVGTTVD